MSKILPGEIMGILRQFEIAGQMTNKKELSHVKEVSLESVTRLLTTVFQGIKYYIVIDNSAEDDLEKLMSVIHLDKQDLRGEFIRNPNDKSLTYGLRFKFKDTYLFAVRPLKTRLDIEITSRYPELTRSTIQKYIKAGFVRVNGEVVTKPKHDVIEHDDLALVIPPKTDFSGSELPILYIDDSVIVINKPAGVLTHSKGALNDEFTVADFFRRYTTNGLETTRPGIVHRLDRDTSGVMIGARTDEAALLLKKQFAQRTVKKAYVAITVGVPKLDHAVIDVPIGRNPSAPSTFRADPSGKSAITTYTVLDSDDKNAIVSLQPTTGRTHQLRVHLQYINTPILGDRIYGQAGDRLFLHAHTLEITIPGSRRETFTSPVPAEFTKRFPDAIYE